MAFSLGLTLALTYGYVRYDNLVEYFLTLLMSLSNLGPQAIFNFSRCLEKQVCKCGQPIKVLGYYVIERYNAVLLLPREWDANKELTSRPMVHLHSNATFCTIPSELVKPFCCHQPPEQAALLFILAEVTLKRRNIPCFIVPLEKGLLQNGPSHWHEYSVASCGSL